MAWGTRESAFTWVFGTAPSTVGRPGQALNNVLGSTGAGVAFNTGNLGASFSFGIETDAASTGSYQIRVGNNATGPWAVISSGTLSTSTMDLVQIPGPLKFLSPRVKTLNSTANAIIVRMEAV